MPRYGRDSQPESKIYVGDLPRDASEKELEKAFTYYGPLKSVWVARNPPGFAFIEFEDVRDAEDAVRGMDGTTLCGSRVRVEHSSGKSGPKPWMSSSSSSSSSSSRGPPRLRKPYDPNDRCYECGGRGHYAYDCTRYGSGGGGGGGGGGRGRRSSRSRSRSPSFDRKRGRSRSRSRGRNNRSKSNSPPRGRYYRSRSRSRSRQRFRTRSKSGSRSPPPRERFRTRSRSGSRSSVRRRSRSGDRKSDRGSPSRNGGD